MNAGHRPARLRDGCVVQEVVQLTLGCALLGKHTQHCATQLVLDGDAALNENG